jgi:hypothetical protein
MSSDDKFFEKKSKLFIINNSESIRRYLNSTQGPGIGNVSEITSHLLLGRTGYKLDKKNELKLNTIVFVGNKSSADDPKSNLVKFINVLISNENFIEVIVKLYDFIYQEILANRRTLILCTEGISLSSSIVVFYLLKRYYLTNFNPGHSPDLVDLDISYLLGIIKFVRESRACIYPSRAYVEKLLQLEFQMKYRFYLIEKQFSDPDEETEKKSEETESE